MSTDPAPDPTAPEAASRIGSILASAERQVTEILAEADRQAAEVHAENARRLQARSAELEEIAAGLVAAAAAAQEQLDRLRGLEPVDLPTAGGGTHGGAGAAAVPAPAPDAPATQPVAASASSGDAPAHDASRGHGEPRNGEGSADGGGILHRPAEWVGFGDPAGRPGSAPGSHDDGDAVDATQAGTADDAWGADAPSPAADGPAPSSPDSPPAELADMPIIAESDGAPYPQDPPEKIDSARLVALSMAANGRSREEVEAHVRDELGIVDHAALIDYVFGISAPSSIVPSWPPRRRRRGA